MRAFYRGDWHSQVFPTVNKISASTGTTVPELKQGLNLQTFLTNLLNSKRNFNKYSRMTFGVAESDEITMPMYLGGSQDYVNISDVTATTESAGQPLGSYAGRGYASGNAAVKFKVPAYGYIMPIVVVTPDLKYRNAVHPRLTQFDALDFPRPEFATNFYVDVKAKDMLYDYSAVPPSGGSLTWDTVVGYTVPYNHYRYSSGQVRGRLASNLSFWNAIHEYALDPKNASVGRVHTYANTHTDKINRWSAICAPLFAVNNEPMFYFDAGVTYNVKRVLPFVDQNLMP